MTTKIALKNHKLKKFIFQILNKIWLQTAERISILNYEIPFYKKMVHAFHSLPKILYDSPINSFYELDGKLNFGKSILYYSLENSPMGYSLADSNKCSNYRVKNCQFQESKKYSTNHNTKLKSHNTRHATFKNSGIAVGVKEVKYLRKHNEIVIYHSSDGKESIFDNSKKANSVDITSKVHCLEKTHKKKFINENDFDIKSNEQNIKTNINEMRVSKDNIRGSLSAKTKSIKSELKRKNEVKLLNLDYQSELKKLNSSFSASRFLNWTNCIQSINNENSNPYVSENNDKSRVRMHYDNKFSDYSSKLFNFTSKTTGSPVLEIQQILLYLKLYPTVLHLHNMLADLNTGTGKRFYGTRPQDQLDIDEFVRKGQICDEMYIKENEEDDMTHSSLKWPSHSTSINQQTLKVFIRKILPEDNFSDDSTDSHYKKTETIDSEDSSFGQEVFGEDKNVSKNDSFSLSKSLSLHKDVLNQMKQLTQFHEKSTITQKNSNFVYDVILEKIKMKHDVPKDDNEHKIENKSYSRSWLKKNKNTNTFSPEKKIDDEQIKNHDDPSIKLNVKTEEKIISENQNEINNLNVSKSTNKQNVKKLITNFKSPKLTNLNQFKKIETEKPETPSNYSENIFKKVKFKLKNKSINFKKRKHENKFYNFYESKFNNKLKPFRKKKPINYESIAVVPTITNAGNLEVLNPERMKLASFKIENAKFVKKKFIEEGQKISSNTEGVKEPINFEFKKHTNPLSNNLTNQSSKTEIAKNEEKLVQSLENIKTIVREEAKQQTSEHNFASKSTESITTRPLLFSMDSPSHKGLQLGKIKSVQKPPEELMGIFKPRDQSQIMTQTLPRFCIQKNDLHLSKTMSSLTPSLSSQNVNRNVSRIVEEIEQDENSSTSNEINNLFQIAQGTKKDLQYMNYFKNRFQSRG